MKVREMSDGSHQFLPEPGDAEYPREPTPVPVPAGATAAERKVIEDGNAAALAVFEKTKPPTSFPAGGGGRLLTAAQAAARPWLKVKEG